MSLAKNINVPPAINKLIYFFKGRRINEEAKASAAW